ncbi:MAG TPA: sulfite exporter TauE/SafE family protein [Actinomycetales bacterium]|nr:sulfite exporter TauE/SafE family protein [Actinomycetales bacterium]
MTELTVVVASLCIGAFVKGLTGFGLPQVAVPILAVFLGVEHAVIIMAIPGVVSNLWLLHQHRGPREPRRLHLRVMMVGSVVGAAGGTLLLKSLDNRLLSMVLALLILGYVVVTTTRPAFRIPQVVHRVTALPVGLLAGGLQGAAGISGPLLTTYMHGLRLRSSTYVYALNALFLIGSVTQTATFLAIGAYDRALLGQSVIALVPIAIGLPLGSWAHRHLSSRTFNTAVLVLLALLGVKLALGALQVA